VTPDTHPHPAPWFHVALHEPEIPNNTGNIGRTCLALGGALHLIHPLGFDLGEKALRRAGLDYWPRLGVREHADYDGYLDDTAPGRAGRAPWMCSVRGKRWLHETDFEPGDHVVFGRETRGLPEGLLERDPDRTIALPMVPGERSLNLATVVCVVAHEIVRSLIGKGALHAVPGVGLRATKKI